MEGLVYKDPIKGYTENIQILNLDDLEVSKDQRKPSKEHIERLKDSISKAGFVSALICIKGEDGKYIIVDGQHRYLAAKELGIDKVPCIVIPKEYGKKLMEFNVEKAPNFREKSYVAYNIYRNLLAEDPNISEMDPLVMDNIESAHFITAGIAYESNPRLYGSAFNSLLKRIDFFLDSPLKDAINVRKQRAETLNKADAALKAAVQAIKTQLGNNNPFLFQEVVSYCNPIGRKRKVTLDFDTVMNEFIEKAEGLAKDPSSFKEPQNIEYSGEE